jgi:hypothetical protein
MVMATAGYRCQTVRIIKYIIGRRQVNIFVFADGGGVFIDYSIFADFYKKALPLF